MLSSFYTLSFSFYLLLGYTSPQAVNSHLSLDINSSPKKRKREPNNDLDAEDLDCSQPPAKKARLDDSGNAYEADFSFGDTTFVDSDNTSSSTEIDFGTGSVQKKIDPRFDFNFDSFNQNMTVLLNLDDEEYASASSPPPPPPPPQPSQESETCYDPSNARHEWELRWFICAHHAAFTAAIGTSLRHETHKRKALSRMWRALKKENDLLKNELEKRMMMKHVSAPAQMQGRESGRGCTADRVWKALREENEMLRCEIVRLKEWNVIRIDC